MDWKRVRELFDAALERPAAERAAWLAQSCGGDEALQANVEQLLQAEGELEGFLDTPVLAQLEEQPTRELTGQRVGAYQVVRELGRGGMGVVYLAERADGEFHKQVAIKLLPTSADEQVRQRFRRERQILADLEHPNIARLLDGGTLDGQPFVVMEFVPGRNLREHLRERGAIPLAEIKSIVQQICAGLAEAHERGIVHRDIKPENLILTERHGQPHLTILDFGIAKLQQSSMTAQTHASVILGTPSYMSPEQAAGGCVSEIDARSDVYSLGMVIYEMLTGAPAFRGDSYASVINQHLHAKPASPHKAHPELAIPQAVSEVVLKALAKAPGERQQSAQQLAAEFAEAFHHGNQPASVRPRRTIGAVTAVVLLLVLGGWAVTAWNKRSVSPDSSPGINAVPAAANASRTLQYRILKKGSKGEEAALRSNDAVRPNDEIWFEFTLPFAGHCYLFFEESEEMLYWMNPRPGQPPQRARVGERLRVPEGFPIRYEEDNLHKQLFIAVFVPDDSRWSLESAVPAAELEKQLMANPKEVYFPYVPIRQPFAHRLRKELQKNGLPVNFANPPVDGMSSTVLPPADDAQMIFHKISFWHLK
ncbi:MAG TPA: serine/threonine-protein kinase [Blastocatellia bacterium]|nr:serine/threonine-protein kinase [Blastocatellia bacterium]HNG31026.1 serine/threonine-protein kinase [Blastocatellia bacterium]